MLLACASETVEAPPIAPANWRSLDAPTALVVKAPTAKEQAIAEAYVAALASPKLAAIGPLFDEMGHITFGYKDARGRDRVVAIHDRLFGSFDDRKSDVTRIWRTDELQIVEWTLSGTQNREWLGVPPTQRPVVIHGITILSTQDDGTSSDAHIYFNVTGVKAQLGVGPKELQDYVGAPPPQAQAKPTTINQTGSDIEKENVVVVRQTLDALEGGKEAPYLASFADDVVVETPLHPKTQKKDDVRAYYRLMRHAISQLDTTIVSIHGIGSYVIVEYMISGSQSAAIGYVPAPPNRQTQLDIVDVIELRDGPAPRQISHVWRVDGPDWPQP